MTRWKTREAGLKFSAKEEKKAVNGGGKEMLLSCARESNSRQETSKPRLDLRGVSSS